jgi:hypothetical protein
MSALLGLAAGVAGGVGTGVVLQWSKARSDMQQWLRDRMLNAVVDFAQASTDAHRVLATTQNGHIDFAEPAGLEEGANAYRNSIRDAASKVARIELLFGSVSDTATSAHALLKAHWAVLAVLDDGVFPPAQTRDEQLKLATQLGQTMNALEAPQAALYLVARREVESPPPLGPLRTVNRLRQLRR